MDHIDNLTLDSWNKNLTMMHFETIKELFEFRDKSQTLMDKVIYNHDHDRMSYFLNFYDLYKALSKPIIEAYRQYHEKFPDENRPDCIGRALKLKKLLSEDLQHEYPDITKALYISSSTFDFYNFTLELTKEMEKNYHYFEMFSEHCVVTLKFQVSSRIGFILYDMSFANIKAVIVMLDNQSPTQREVTLNNNQVAFYKCVSENFVEVFYSQGDQIFRVKPYVGAAFSGFDVSARFCVQYNLTYKYVVRRGIMLTRITFYPTVDDVYCHVYLWDESKGKYDRSKIPIEYFRQDTKDDDYELIIDRLSQFLGEDRVVVRENLVKLSFIQVDKEFLEQLNALHLTLRKARRKYLDLYHPIDNKSSNIDYPLDEVQGSEKCKIEDLLAKA